MHQSILMHANIDKRTERSDVSNDALKNHAWLQVAQRFHALLKRRSFEFRPWIATRFLQLFQDIGHGR